MVKRKKTPVTDSEPSSASRKKPRKLRAREAWRPLADLVAERRLAFPLASVDDLAETPLDAFRDIAPLFGATAAFLGKPRAEVIAYDPYFADGGVATKLRSLGLARVVNRNRDFYADVASGAIPPHDILLTNPPYSSDHVERLVKYCVSTRTASSCAASSSGPCAEATAAPFALLLPTYVLGKPYWRAAIAALKPAPIYVMPHKRYAYEPPRWARRDDAAAPTKTAPFPTGWFVWLPAGFRPPTFAHGRVDVFPDAASVSSDHRDLTDPSKKRPNPRTRRKRAAKRADKATAYANHEWRTTPPS